MRSAPGSGPLLVMRPSLVSPQSETMKILPPIWVDVPFWKPDWTTEPGSVK